MRESKLSRSPSLPFSIVIIFILLFTFTPAYTSALANDTAEANCTSLNQTMCLPGEYFDACTDLCQDCIAGNFCPGGCQAEQQLCTNGTYSAAGSLSCDPCPAGHFCIDPASKTECPAGTFSSASSLTCTPCEVGTYSNVTASETCNTCPAGSSCPGVAMTPEPCEAGTYSMDGSVVCGSCPLGTYSNEGSQNCNECQPGHICLDPSQPMTPCLNGTYSAGFNSTECLICESGKTNSNSRTGCDVCPVGFDCTNPLAPTQCDDGLYNNGTGSCVLCPEGHNCPAPYETFIACTIGTYSSGGTSDCMPCPAGTSCEDNINLVNCVAGQYSAEGDGICKECEAGYMCPTPDQAPIVCANGYYSYGNQTECTLCPAGSKCPSKTDPPVECNAGEYSFAGATLCINCPAGYKCNNKTSSPELCDGGEYSTQGDTVCTICPAGSKCPQPDTNPEPCLAGSYAVEGSLSCTPCPPGFACNSTTNATMTACLSGTYATGGAPVCTACPAGSYCPNTESDLAVGCPGGYYSIGDQNTCTICPAGSECPSATSAPSVCSVGTFALAGTKSCIACPAGYSCATNHDNHVPCPTGSYSLDGAGVCTECPAGKACPNNFEVGYDCLSPKFTVGNRTTCTECPEGYDCPNTDGSGIAQCDDGYYRTHGMATCTICPAGHSCFNPASEPKICDIGYYSPEGTKNCTMCSEGYKCLSSGSPAVQVSEVPCEIGTYSHGLASACLPCAPGYLCSVGSNTSTPMDDECPAGKYCLKGASAGIDCPDGTYRNTTGAGSIADCPFCPAGFSCPAGTSDPVPCKKGHYCSIGAFDTVAERPCLAGTYNNGTGLGSADDCDDCIAGHFCESGTVEPEVCPLGYYCPTGTGAYSNTPCPAGTYGATTGLAADSDCTDCLAGYYCPQGSRADDMYKCPIGTFSTVGSAGELAACTPCTAGSACPEPGTSTPVGCDEGHFCPTGTHFKNANKCPPGTWSEDNDAGSECDPCPAGYACGWATTSHGGTNPPGDCAFGHFCPEGTPAVDHFPCPDGYWSFTNNASSAADCDLCPGGSFCGNGITGPCDVGHFCPAGTNASSRYPCAAGTFSQTTNSSQCADCSLGHFCPVGAVDPVPCRPGTFSNQMGTESDGYLNGAASYSVFPQCESCTAGYECENEGTVNPVACLAGEYSPIGSTSCLACPQGYYCNTTAVSEVDMIANKKCPAGMYCPEGTNVVPTSPAYDCPVGKYCDEATPFPVNCPKGYYRNDAGAGGVNECYDCPAGSYCLEGCTDPTGLCDPGYYCPVNSHSATMEPCPGGSFSTINGTANCTACSPGYYCPVGAEVEIDCPLGYYCQGGNENPSQCLPGSYGNETNMEACRPCDGGAYCDTYGLIQPTGICVPGYYCSSGSPSSMPAAGSSFGGPCPRGGFCVAGSAAPEPCPPGTYQNVSGARSNEDCVNCEAGYYCSSTAIPEPTGMCDAGYYCKSGSASPRQFSAQPGYYAPRGSPSQIPCEAGTYSSASNSAECTMCKAGYYCESIASSDYVDCPVGHYCPEGSYVQQQCPRGSYQPYTRQNSSDACVLCPPGEYCLSAGLEKPNGNCSEGFYCTEGSYMQLPIGVSFGDECPKGHYCPLGTGVPIACPTGYFRGSLRGISIDDCEPCPQGKACALAGQASPTSDCGAGYYCTGATPTASPLGLSTGDICPKGSFCTIGSTGPTACPAGKYSANTGSLGCATCPAGYYCAEGASDPIICPESHYCPEGTTTSIPVCPVGTFGNSTGYTDISECHDCPPGYYCLNEAASEPEGECLAKYFCPGKCIDQFGRLTVDGTPNECPAGSYCPTGTPQPINCDAGTYLPATASDEIEDCLDCPSGKYCSTTGLTEPTGICDAGYICDGGSATATPTNQTGGGYVCPYGKYCLAGDLTFRACYAGSYQDDIGATDCKPCPPGYYCLTGIQTFEDTPCPAGYYCLAGTASKNQSPCPQGTFMNVTGATNSSDCVSCPYGKYCGTLGSTEPDGLCAAGYFCLEGASVQSPTDGVTGDRCAPGYYCPEGSQGMTPCTEGQYCGTVGLTAPTGDCDEGYYCPGGNDVPNPAATFCPRGHYCPAKSSFPIGCPLGTYNPTTGATSADACVSCGAGFYCNTTGAFELTEVCPAGYYCPAGTGTPTLQCTPGHYCEEQSHEPRGCPLGTYQNETGQSDCMDCPEGYYCEGTARVDIVDCPMGSYCPANTTFATQYVCPSGTFSNRTHLTSVSQCLMCTPGMYCLNTGLITPEGLCQPGYYCKGGADSPTPTEYHVNDICPSGAYCPEGSEAPIACGLGSFSAGDGNDEEDDCAPCPPGKYCSSIIGADGVNISECDPGFVCYGGAHQGAPFDNVTGSMCKPGYYCEAGSFTETECYMGTYNSEWGQSACQECSVGHKCDERGLTTPIDCPMGFYCESQTITPKPCPIGTYSDITKLTSVEQCTDCGIGEYCDVTNLTAPTGPCSAGYMCNGGATRPDPPFMVNITNATNYPCPIGHYCLEGTGSPSSCDPGFFNPSTGADEESDCLACTAGFYCGQPALSQPTDECVPGSYCPVGSSSSTEKPCGAGHFCVKGSSHPASCLPSTYQPDEGQTGCLECPAGYYCNTENMTSPLSCPVNFYCPASTAYPVHCKNGTYGTSTNLKTADECAPCPAGKYCQGGIVAGDCDAGYICYSGVDGPIPGDNVADDLTHGGVCPAGHYCLAGTVEPTPCPADTLRTTPGASMLSECLNCPAGYDCLEGDPVPRPCPVGGYCTDEGSFIGCPKGSFSTSQAATNETICIPCPAGYFCDETGIADYSLYPCPQNYYCPVSTLTPIVCPAGTINRATLGESLASCSTCPGGYYCFEGTNVTLPCYAKHYCPDGSFIPLNCTGGNYCPAKSSEQIPCPLGVYCPPMSDAPLPCPIGHYCPGEVAAPIPCPDGWYSLSNRTTLMESCAPCPAGTYQSNATDRACATCANGYICTGTATTPKPVTSLDGGYICPVGHYCPAGATKPTACPVGKYNALTGQHSSDACLECEANTFNELTGQSGCKACASSASSGVGATSCSCIGKHRTFQESKQACVCKPYYEFYVGTAAVSDEDGKEDCQSIVFERCQTGYSRDASGNCVSKADGNCAQQCDGREGIYSVSLGTCECLDVEPLDEVCDENCRNSAPVMTYTESGIVVYDPSDTNKTTATQFISWDSIPGFFGVPTCPDASCGMLSMVAGGNGLGGTYDLPNTLDQLVVQSTSTLKRKEERKSFLMGRREHRSFRSQAYGRGDGDNEGADVRGARNIKTLNINADTTINPAIMCLELNEAVFFDVSSGSVPTYDKDNLLNTNDNFDFGYFKEIASAAVNSSSLQVFVFSFTEPGIYVLVDSADAAKYTVLKVTKSSESCPSDSRIVPFTLSNLVMMGVEREDDLVVSPDWFLIGMMLCLIAVMFIMIVAGIYYFQQHTWGQSRPHYAAYKDTALDPDLDLWQFYSSGTIPTMGSLTKGLRHLNELGGDSFFSEGDSGEGDSFDDMQAEGKTNAAPKKKKKKVEAPAYLPDADKDLGDKGPQFGDEFMNELSDNFDFEGFDFNALYRMMDETKSKMDGFIGKTNENLTSFYDRLSLETEHIKTVLAVKMHVQLNLSQEGFEDAIEDLVSGELLARQAYVDLSRRKHELFKKTLKELDSQIRNISDIDYNVFPVKELVRNVGAQIESMRKNSKQERKRRQTFASHVQIVGRPIIDALENIDREEAALQDDYLGAVTYFNKSINVELEVCLKMEDVFATEMEKLQHSSLKKRTRVTDEYHLNLLKQVKAIMVQIHYLDERLHPIMRNIYREDAKIRDVWTTVQTGMLEHRWLEVKHPTDGRLFRGINPDLAKVLAGLLGMRDGIEVDPVTGAYHAKTPFDPTDPFAAIEDPFPVEEEEEEESGDGKKKRKKKKKKKKGSGGGDDLYDLPDIPIGCDISEMTKHKDMALAQIEQDIEEIMADDSYDPEEREDLIQRMHEDKNAVLLAYKEDVINMVNIFEHDQLHAMSVEEADNAAVMEARNKLDEEFAELEAMKLKHEEEYKDLERTMDQEMRAEEELIELGGLDKLADLSEFGAQMGEYEIDMAELEQLSLPERAEKVKAIRREKRLKMKKKKLAELRTKHQKQLLLAERRMKNKKAGLDKQLEHQEQVKKLVTQAVEEAKEKIILQVSAMENDPSQANDFIRQEQNTHGEKLEVIKQHVLSLRLAAQSKLTAMEEFEYARMDVLMEKKQSSALLPQQKEVDELSRRLQDLIKIPPALRSGDENEGRLMVMIKQATADRDKIAQMLEIEKKSSVHGVQKKLENMKKISDMTVESEASMAIRKEEVRHEFNLRFERLALESKIIADALEALEPKDRRAAAKNMIELVLRPRHNKEMQSQLNDHFQERNVRFQKLIAAAEDGYDSKELRGKVNNEYDDRHATESSTLNNRQKEDIKAIFQKIYSDETFEGKEWQVGDGEDALAEFHRKRRKVADQQLNKEMEEHEKEFKEKAAQQAREHDARLKQDQEEFERMVAEADKRAHDRMVKRREMEDALKLAEIEEMQGLGMKEREDIMNQHRENMLRYEEALNSERVRQRQNFIKNLATMRERRARVLEKVRGAEEKKLREEKKKKLAELQRQREERRKERAQREKEMKSKLMSKKDQEVAAQVERWKKQQERTALAMLGISTSAGEGEGKEGEGKEGEAKAKAGEAKTGIDETNLTEAEKERLKVLMRLERIEEMITDIGDGAEQYREQAYVDAKDKSDPEYQAKSDSPVAMQPHEMSARVFVLYRFAMALIQTLVNANIISSPGGENQPIKLLVAQSIPENPHKSTAFRNSFFYMQLTNTLFIRHQRMQNVGEFVLVLLHSLAHINTSASNGEWDDRNPEFLRSFYQTLSLATGELFFARSEKALEMVGGEGEGQDGKSSSSSLASSAASLFGKITGRAKGSNSTRWQFSALLSQVKESGVDDLIDLHPISSQGVVAGDVMAGATNIEYFSSQRVFKRLEEYTEFKRSVDLRSHLEELEGASKMRDQSREKNQRDTFTRHNLKGAKAQRLRALEKDVWKSMAPRDGPVDRFVLENINDRINKEVVGVVEEICKASTKLHELETQRDSLVLGMQGDGGDSNDEGAAAKADATSAVSSTELAGVEEAIVRQHQIIGRLASEKDVLVQRLRNVQEAVSELSGE